VDYLCYNLKRLAFLAAFSICSWLFKKVASIFALLQSCLKRTIGSERAIYLGASVQMKT